VKCSVTYFINNFQAKIILFFILNLFGTKIAAQILPVPNSTIHYTDVYFEEMWVNGATVYELNLINLADTLLIQTQKSPYPAFWMHHLKWGQTYQWYIKTSDKNGDVIKLSKKYYFSIININLKIFDSLKVEVKKDLVDSHNHGFIGIDYTKSFINRAGIPVWTLPDIKGFVSRNTLIRDLKVTKEHTITLLTDTFPIEINYAGQVLWHAPFPLLINADTIRYHHDFKKINKDSYYVLGNKRVYRKLIGSFTETQLKNELGIKKINQSYYRLTDIPLLLQFNAKAELIWYWDASSYLSDEDLNKEQGPNNVPLLSSHLNAFSVNENGDKIYLGFRDLNRIIKLNKRKKKIELTFGQASPSGEPVIAADAFAAQHDANITNRGSIYLLNNGLPSSNSASSILEINENYKPNENSILWDFSLKFDDLSNGKSLKGGNVSELPNGNLLVCAGFLNRVFEMTKEKKIVWDAFIFSKRKSDAKWSDFPQYRSSWTDTMKQFQVLLKMNAIDSKNEKRFASNVTIINTSNTQSNFKINLCNMKSKIIDTIETPSLDVGASFQFYIDAKLSSDFSEGMIIKVFEGKSGSLIRKQTLRVLRVD
jgi:hypothetical protein